MSVAPFTVAASAEPVGSRARRGKFGIVAVVLLVLLVVSIAVTQKPSDYQYLSTNNATPTGTRALAQILRAQGVEVRQIDALSRAAITTSSDTTLVIGDPGQLNDAQAASIADYAGPVVVLGVSDAMLASLGVDATAEFGFLPETVAAQCADADARAAGEMRVEGAGIDAGGPIDGDLCFTQRGGVAGYLATSVDGYPRRIIANADAVTNGALVDAGHAALALRAIGTTESVVWYVATGFDPTLLPVGGEAPDDIQVSPDFLPPGFGPMLLAVLFAALTAAVWRARRFGPLVTEPLPVVVRASEVTRGRARLYRRAHAYGRAAATMRGATARRIAVRLGVPRGTGADALVAAIAQATGREDAAIRSLLYGPAPADQAAMTDIIRELDILESEVHRP